MSGVLYQVGKIFLGIISLFQPWDNIALVVWRSVESSKWCFRNQEMHTFPFSFLELQILYLTLDCFLKSALCSSTHVVWGYFFCLSWFVIWMMCVVLIHIVSVSWLFCSVIFKKLNQMLRPWQIISSSYLLKYKHKYMLLPLFVITSLPSRWFPTHTF